MAVNTPTTNSRVWMDALDWFKLLLVPLVATARFLLPAMSLVLAPTTIDTCRGGAGPGGARGGDACQWKG